MNYDKSGGNSFSASGSFSLVDLSVPCVRNQYNKAFEAVVKVDITAAFSGDISYGVTLEGSIVSPVIQDLSVHVGFDSELTSTFSFKNFGTVRVILLILQTKG